MPTMFNEDNTIEQMMISALKDNGWKYIPAENLPRLYSDVLVEPMTDCKSAELKYGFVKLAAS